MKRCQDPLFFTTSQKKSSYISIAANPAFRTHTGSDAVIQDDYCALASADMNVNLISHRNVEAGPLHGEEDCARQNAREQVLSIYLILPQ